MPKNDNEWLREYVEQRSEKSFTALVQSHLNLVYSAALRQVRSPHLAQEISQCVFADLARSAHRLAPDTILTAWLYQVTRRTAIDVVRRESRRQFREQIAVEMNATNQTDPTWSHLEPLLDEAMHSLDDTDRTAILLRYFDNKSLREVGAVLGVSDDAAQKRVTRAVERLHGFFEKRGVAVAISGLIVLVSANAVQSAPASLAIAISSAAFAAGTPVTVTIAKTLAMTTLQKTLVAVGITGAVAFGFHKGHQASVLQNKVEILEQQQAFYSNQVQQLQQERDAATNRLVAISEEIARSKSNQNSAEVLRLRSEVSQLRSDRKQASQTKAALDSNDPATQSFLAARAVAEQIAGALAKMPDKAIPELKLLTDVDWLSATKEAQFDTDADVRKTLRNVRNLAKRRLPLGSALFSFTQANQGQLPSSLSQLKPYFLSQLNYSSRGTAQLDDGTLDSIFSRYELLHSGNVSDYPPATWFIAEKAPVDKDYDSRVKFGNGMDTVIDTGLGERGDPDDASY